MLYISPARWLPLVAAISITAACATPGPQLTESVGTIRTGVALADQQSNAAMANANALARQQSLEYKIGKPEFTLAESDFIQAVDDPTMAAWREAFGALDDYLAALQTLVAPARSQETGTQLLAVGTALTDGALGLKLPNGTAGVFSALGSAIVQARAERKAIDVMRRVDPAFQQVTQSMASAIGEDDSANLRGTARVNWERVLSRLRVEYSGIAPASNGRFTPEQVASRRRIAQAFVTGVDSRAASDANLRQLRTSILALGEAHHAAAEGRSGDALFWIERISGWVDDARERIEAAKGAKA